MNGGDNVVKMTEEGVFVLCGCMVVLRIGWRRVAGNNSDGNR